MTMEPADFKIKSAAEITADKDNFFQAVNCGSVRGVRAFLDKHPDCATWTRGGGDFLGRQYEGGSALHGTAAYGGCEITELLIKNGADLNAKDNAGNTPLMVAFTHGRADVAKLLVNADARPDIPNNDGVTVMDLLADGPVPNMIREKMQRQAASAPAAAGVSISNISHGGSVHIAGVSEGTTIKNISAKGDIVITGIGKPKTPGLR